MSKTHHAMFDAPRTPQRKKAPPTWGKPSEGGGLVIAFSYGSVRYFSATPPNPWIAIIFCCYFLGLAKAPARLSADLFPRIASFFPRVCLFLPRARFFVPRLFFSLSSFFERERERREGKNAKSDDPRIQYVTRGYKTYGSWKKRLFSGNPGDAFLGTFQHWRGFAGDQASIPGFFTRNAPPSLDIGLAGGAHGSH